MEITFSLIFLSSAVICIFMIIYGLTTGKILSNVGLRMKMVTKKNNPRSFWMGFAGFLIFGIMFILVGISCLIYC